MKLLSLFKERGVKVKLHSQGAALVGLAGEEDFAEGVDLVIALGGDGTMLEAIHRVNGVLPPIAGINIGTLGFLTTCQDDSIEAFIDCWAKGEHQVVERSMLQVEMTSEDGKEHTFNALNEVVLVRGETGRLVSLEARVDGELLNHYRADGLILSTPTGSTAYSLSAGGPLIGPRAKVFAITPICPHSLNNRSLVVDDDSIVEFLPSAGKDEPLLFNADGREMLRLDQRSMIRVQKAKNSLLLVRMPEHSFYETLRKKLHWHPG